MKTKQLLLSFMAVALIGGTALFFLNDVKTDFSSDKRYKVREADNSVNNPNSAAGAAKWMSERRVNPATGTISDKDVEIARASFESVGLTRNNEDLDMNWEFVGPDDVGGRTRAFLVDNRDNSTLWAGGVAGGIWKSNTNGQSWIPIALEAMDNINVSAMCQDNDGVIYVGTGEDFASTDGYTGGTPGFRGGGIWKSTDGISFTHIDTTKDPEKFRFVNEIICDPATNALYAATNAGILKSTDAGETWENPFVVTGNARDVKVTSSGNIIFTMSTNSESYVFTSIAGAEPVRKHAQFDSGMNRIELAVAPSDNNYIYALCSYWVGTPNKFFNLYRSIDGGDTWTTLIVNHSSSVDVFRNNSQGDYDNVIAVFPDNKNKVVFGGIDLWTWDDENAFEQISFWIEAAEHKYVHADQHCIVFHPNYEENKTIYFTNDGGIFATYNAGFSFTALNKNYGVTQYYAIDCGPKGEILGGTQDNGTPYINLRQYGNAKSSIEFTGGDGGFAAISELYPEAIFSTTYYCTLQRSNENGAEATIQYNPYDSKTRDQLDPGNGRNPFVTPIDMWEDFDYDSSRVYIPYVVDTVIEISNAGVPDTILTFGEGYTFAVQSTVVSARKFEYTITAEDIEKNGGDLVAGDTIPVREKFGSLMAIGGAGNNNSSGKLYITRNILDFKDETPKWDAIVSKLPPKINDHLDIRSVSYVKWAPDGNSLYAIARDSYGKNGLYRFTGIKNAYNYVDELNNPKPVAVYDSRIIDNYNVIDLTINELNDCDTTEDNGLDYDALEAVTLVDEEYTHYSLETGDVVYENIYELDSASEEHHMLNLISLDFATCDNDTIFNISADSLTLGSSEEILHVDSVYTTNLTYANVIKLDTVQMADPDTLIDIITKVVVDGVCVIDTIESVNNDSIMSVNGYEVTLDFSTMTTDSGIEYLNLVKLDTVSSEYITLIDFTYNDLSDDCDDVTIENVNIDTVINFETTTLNRMVYEVEFDNGSPITSVLSVDTVATADTSYVMGVQSDDMVWNTREINTISSVVGTKIKEFDYDMPTSISIDPKNVDNLLVTVGGYGTHDKLYYTTNATTTTESENDFTVIDGPELNGIPKAPVYSSLISDTVANGSDLIIVGTEFGVYSTSNVDGANTIWKRETAMPKVPVVDLRQQRSPNGYVKGVGVTGVENSGVIYAGTHGLGAWKMDTLMRPYTNIPEITHTMVDVLTVKVYPNPVKTIANIEYEISNTSDVKIEVFSLTGKLVYTHNIANQYKGTHTHRFNTELLSNGVYVVSLTNNNERKVSKIVVE